MSSTFKQAVTGFNHNIKHKGKVYHIQTEDSGVNNPHLITHLFVGGNILASKKTSYADILGVENLSEVVRELMEEQHKEMLRNLVNGLYDDFAENMASSTKSYQPGQLGEGAPAMQAGRVAPLPLQLKHPVPAEVLAARQLAVAPPIADGGETLFGEDLISEKSLDEVILSYLAGDPGEK